jgi:hypothetical protein
VLDGPPEEEQRQAFEKEQHHLLDGQPRPAQVKAVHCNQGGGDETRALCPQLAAETEGDVDGCGAEQNAESSESRVALAEEQAAQPHDVGAEERMVGGARGEVQTARLEGDLPREGPDDGFVERQPGARGAEGA